MRLEARRANSDGVGEVPIRRLVTNALRMRPDRIVVGEVRGAEVLDMAQAMNCGHEGSLSTCHANSPDDALRRLEAMALLAGDDLPLALRAPPARRGRPPARPGRPAAPTAAAGSARSWSRSATTSGRRSRLPPTGRPVAASTDRVGPA